MFRAFAFSLVLLAAAPAAADAPTCRLCGASAPVVARDTEPATPLRIEITADLDFSRVAASGAGGAVRIDPVSGSRQVAGQLTDLGGVALRGEARLTGAPGRFVRVDLPDRIELTAADGSVAVLNDVRTDLPMAPQLDAAGKLGFAFGGTLAVSNGVRGNYRGRIAITADYR